MSKPYKNEEYGKVILAEKTKTAEVLFEDFENGFAYGHTDNFIEIKLPSDRQKHAELETVRLKSTDGKTITAETL